MEDEELDDMREYGGFTSSFASSVARGNNACKLVARRNSNKKMIIWIIIHYHEKIWNKTIKIVMIAHLKRIVSLARMTMKEISIILPAL